MHNLLHAYLPRCKMLNSGSYSENETCIHVLYLVSRFSICETGSLRLPDFSTGRSMAALVIHTKIIN